MALDDTDEDGEEEVVGLVVVVGVGVVGSNVLVEV